MFSFIDINYLYLIIILPFLYILISHTPKGKSIFSKDVLDKILVKNYGLSKKTRNILVLLSMAFFILALSRPVIKGKEIELENDKMDVIVALDISDSMSVNDIFPSRFEFAKNKFHSFLDSGADKRVGVLTFASKAFVISPITSDLNSLKFLVDNLAFENFSLKGTSTMSVLEATKSLSKEKKKTLLIFSDGGDKESFDDEIEYANNNGITIFIYLTATDKGSLFKTPNGDMVVLKANKNISSLATKTGGALMRSMESSDMKKLNELISSKKEKNDGKTSVVVGQKELFYYPLMFGILLIFISSFSLPRKSKR